MRPATSRALALLFFVASVLGACQQAGPPSAEPVARAYAEAWQKGDVQAMWALLTDESKQRVGEEGFVRRLPRIAEEMSLTSLGAKAGTAASPRLPNGSPEPARATVPLSVTFRTARVGDFSRETSLRLVLEGEKEKALWRIDWTPEAILPRLTPGRLVRMTRLATSRGRIVTRDGTELASFIEGAVVGVVPGQIKSEAGMLSSLASALALTPDTIKAKY